jgi:hypothetical protein
MRRSRVVLLAVVIAVLVILILPGGMASANSIGLGLYANDWPGWQHAVGTYGLENFNDPYLNPNVSVVSDGGYVDWEDGIWYDQLYGGRITTWYFAHPIKAWGGWWDLYDAGGPESGVDVWINVGGWVHVGMIPANYQWYFWGLVTTTPFTAVRLAAAPSDTYYLDNMVWSTTVYYPGFIGKGMMRPGCFGLTTSP